MRVQPVKKILSLDLGYKKEYPRKRHTKKEKQTDYNKEKVDLYV